MTKTSVTVLGLGLMGGALAEALLRDGRTVTVWNRSRAKAEPLVAKGAVAAESAEAAVSASPLVIVCLSVYANAEEILGGAATGRTIVQLTNGTPRQARAMADRAAGLGARYVDGGIMAVPPMIGQPEALILYSGDQEAFEEHRETLAVLGRPQFLGADPGLAPLFDLALLDAMYGMFAGIQHAFALVRSEKVAATDFEPMATAWLTAMLGSLPEQAHAVEAGDFATTVSSVATSQMAFPGLIETSRDQGVDPGYLPAVQALLDRAVKEGHGEDGLARLITLLESP
ncbi:3-hydroxyisobutyrate dehydrogenase-like beta-hydroxyacid dehydrogenase [Actinomadura coerulea]|uniref:3-hydroxyisobutyrate dehydrogenase-like beta-hydroxyacid dehydrogenase n=1 Tax=Actinomadura coerulea TaxID=46159 RepID=A0A7X0KZU2_9ACTN|nr:NAD(P)-binding domain-containing protein [Actinomadura coerulea]MBB6396795.1 3-hydroxyisobutyrate dehydrogenase-like beta-hydroxyacid dehydrogenase [Actinomadura coerulea]GGP94596.1 dehydrogenase [Actinomadura coerulea]